MKKFLILCACALAVLTASARKHVDGSISALCSKSALEASLDAPMKFAPVPGYGDPYWQTIPQEMRSNFIKQAEWFVGKEWPDVDYQLFSEFRTNGNRTNYEKFIFEKRKRLGSFVMAELMEGKGRFMPEIVKGVESLCAEPWWGIPAHYPTAKPVPETQPLALFSAETGAMAAWIYYLLGDQLDKAKPGLARKLRDNVQHRINDEGLRTREWWRGAGMNWNPWICSNWLTAVLFTEKDRNKQIKAVQEIAASLDGFIDQYPDDGGCDEGANYWDRAAGSLLDCLLLLNKCTGGAVDISDDERLIPMAEYIGKMNIDNVHFVNFADAYPKIGVRPEWFPGAVAIGCDELMSLTASYANSRNYYTKPSELFRADNIAPIGRELFTLASLNELKNSASEVVLPFDAWLPRLQVIAARSYPNSTEGLYFAAKGGHNEESHNHNDVGEFIVYADGKPLLVDVGSATYTSKTFTGERYTQWNVQSGYHNLPQINGVDQRNGKDYHATKVKSSINKNKVKFSLDIAQAYPKEAQVKSWERSIEFKRGDRITVKEKYKLNAYKQPTKLLFMSQQQPVLSEGRVRIGDYALLYNPSQLEAKVEIIKMDDDLVKSNWTHLYRIVLTVKSHALSGNIKYEITKL